MNKMEECSLWLNEKLIQTDFKERELGKELVVKIKYKDLIRLFIKFIKILRG